MLEPIAVAKTIVEANCHQRSFDIVLNLGSEERQCVIDELRLLGCKVEIERKNQTLTVVCPGAKQ